MPVIRKTVRHAIVALMQNIPDVSVYSSRIYPLTSLPAISVYITDEVTDEETMVMGGDNDERTLNIRIEISDKATDKIDDNLDDLAFLVEQEMKTDKSLGGLVNCLQYMATSIELSADTESAVGVAQLNYVALT